MKKVENNEYGIDELGARLKEALALVALCKKRLTRADAQIKELLGQE